MTLSQRVIVPGISKSIQAVVAALSLLILPLVYAQTSRSPRVEIKGDSAWFDNTPEAEQYLLRRFTKADTNVTIEWPPRELSRIIDISVDVTGSVFNQFVQFEGHKISLAEYNVRQLSSLLFVGNSGRGLVHPGDRIVLRLFAARPGGQDISVDEYREIDFPPDRVGIEAVNILTRRFSDRQIIVDKVLPDLAAQQTAKNAIIDWLSGKVREVEMSTTRYVESPLLKHIWKIAKLRSESHDVKTILIFATDGYFHIGSLYFSPKTYSKNRQLPDRVQEYVSKMDIKPFTAPQPNITVIMLGLSYQEDEQFRQAQDKLLRWFFSPLAQESITLIFN